MTISAEKIGRRSLSVIGKILKYLGLGIGAVIGILIIMSFLNIALPLNFLKNSIQEVVRNSTDRNMQIDGDIGLIPGLSPLLFIEQTSLENPDIFENRIFISAGEISAQIHLVPLLRKKIKIGHVFVDNVLVNLIDPVEDDPNWIFTAQNKSEEVEQNTKPETTEQQEPENASNSLQFVSIDELKLSGTSLVFENLKTQSKQKLQLETAIVQAVEDQPIMLSALGSINTLPLTLNANSASISELMKLNGPLGLKANAGIGELKMDIDASLVQQGVQLTAEIEGTDLAELNEPLGLALPPLKEYQISTSAHYAGTELKIDMLNVTFDDSAISGSASLNHGTSPISLSGQLDIESLNLDPFLELVDDSDSEQGEGKSTDAPSTPKSEDLSGIVEQLVSYKVDVGIDVKRLKAGGALVSHSNLQINLDKGVLDTPLNINLNGVPLQGNLSVSGKDRVVSVDAFLEVENNDIRDLEKWFQLDGIDGSLGKFNIEATSRGDSITTLISSLTTKLEISDAKLSYGDLAEGKNVSFELESLRANVAGNSPLIIKTNGQLLGESFSLNLEGGKLKQLARGNEWPMAINASGAGASLIIDGFIRKSGEATGSELRLSLSGPKLGELHRWLGVKENAAAAYNINATATAHHGNWKVDDLNIDLGNTEINSAIAANENKTGKLFQIDVNSNLIDIPELTSFFPVVEQEIPEPKQNGEPKIDESPTKINPDELRNSIETALKIPILPDGIELPDSNIKVNLVELRMDSISIEDVGFEGSVRNGVLDSSPYSMKLGGSQFSGSIAFDSMTRPATAKLVLETRDINIGDFLSNIQISEDVNATSSLLEIQLDLEGYSLGNILRNSTVKARIREGQWTLGEPDSSSERIMEIIKGDFVIAPGKPIKTTLDVVMAGEPVTIDITNDHPATRMERENAHTQIDLKYLGNALTLVGYTALPLKLHNLNLDLKLDGKNLGSLSKLAGVRIPETGPYKFVGNFAMRKNGYFIDKLKTKFGESVLSGTAKYRTDTDVPEFEVLLVSDRLQLNDFKTEQQKSGIPVESESQDTVSTESQENNNPVTDESPPTQRFTAESLGMANGRFNLKVKEVLSGEDWLGEGEINITLRDSHLDFNPFELKLPGGKFDASVSLHPENDRIRAGIKASIDQFDYGILARRTKPESTMSGLIYLDINLDSQAKYLDKMMANANGHIDFLLLPEEFEAGIIDLWASNLLVAMLPKIGSNVSLINCVIAKFNIEDGIMTEEDLYLDTSKLRAKGKGEINFKDETISYVLKPKAKNAGFFQAQAPINIDGEFSSLKFGLDGGIIGTALRMAATTYTVPIRILMGNDVPKDGSDICVPLEKRERN